MTKNKAILFASVAAAGMLGGCIRERAAYYPAYPVGGYAYQPYQQFDQQYAASPQNYAPPNYAPQNNAPQNVPQNYSPQLAPQAGAAATAPLANSDVRFSAEQLDQMLGPIALYPDPLLTEVLAAATYPQDIAELDGLLKYDSNPSDDELQRKVWDSSVKALAKYPSVVQMMAGQRDWTAGLGAAMVNQPQGVMDSVQRLRATARAAQNLNTTQQQEVIADAGVIQILPAQPQVIFVPVYDPLVVYTPQPFGTTCIWFGVGIGINRFWDLDCDWHHRSFNRGVRWDRDWHRPVTAGNGHWQHDGSRPIPAPGNAFVPPRGVDGRAAGVKTPTLSTAPQHTLPAPKPITPQRSVPMTPAVTAAPQHIEQRQIDQRPSAPQLQTQQQPRIIRESPRIAPPAQRVTTGAPSISSQPIAPSIQAPSAPRVISPLPQIPAAPRVQPAPVQPVQPVPAQPARQIERHVPSPFPEPAAPAVIRPMPQLPSQITPTYTPPAYVQPAPQVRREAPPVYSRPEPVPQCAVPAAQPAPTPPSRQDSGNRGRGK